jgi:ADP-ribose pyrophosphatase
VREYPPAGDLSGCLHSASDLAWEVLYTETLVSSPWLRVHRQRVRTASGHEIPEYYVVDSPDFIVVLALTEEAEVILVDQYRHGVARTVLELPAGLVDPADASPAAAAERELLEETGYRPARLEPLGRLFPSTSRQSNMTHCFLALGCQPVAEPGGDLTESIQLRLQPLLELRAAARRGELPSQASLSCLFLGMERLRELGVLR